MNRNDALRRLASQSWDMLIVGGGATGLGAAVDAATRGLQVALVEQHDFAKGTSSRSTKLIHGGVRYLQQGNVQLVAEALRERWLLIHNAPHLVRPLEFIVPSQKWFDTAYYGTGLKLYDLLAGKHSLGRSARLSRRALLDRIPTLKPQGLRGGTSYFDAQFDDARLAIALAKTAHQSGACLANYTKLVEVRKNASGRLMAAIIRDEHTQDVFEVPSQVIINAAGPFCDKVRQLDDPKAAPLITPSQGTHIVVDARFLPGDCALMIPRTRDGRLIFAIPWQGATVVGTTDTKLSKASLEPKPLPEEIEFLLDTLNPYLNDPIGTGDIRSAFSGIRPLVAADSQRSTAKLSREHRILVDPKSAMLTVTGGKWTTYRKMAEDTIDRAVEVGQLSANECQTSSLALYGSPGSAVESGALAGYGSDADLIRNRMRQDPTLAQRAHPDLPLSVGEISWACEQEMAQSVEDVLARRSRWLTLDARNSIAAARKVAEVMALLLQRDASWIERQVHDFTNVASAYIYGDAST